MDSRLIGTVSVDTAEIALVDAMYMLTDADHAADRSAHQVVPNYDGVLVPVDADGELAVFVDTENGQLARRRIEPA
jgi:hypothetical protein